MSEKEILEKIESYLKEKKEKELLKKIEDFHRSRAKEIKEDTSQLFVPEWGKIVLHLIPLESFVSQKHYDLSNYKEQFRKINPYKFSNSIKTYNFDGAFYYTEDEENKYYDYFLVYSNGIIEEVEGHLLSTGGNNQKRLYILDIEKEIIASMKDGLQFQEKLDIKPPIIFYLAFLGVRGFSIPNERERISEKYHPIERDDLYFPKLTIEKFDIDLEKELKPYFDRLWNSCGHPRSRSYDENGQRIKK